MKYLVFLLFAVLAACATVDRAPPLSAADLIELSKSGAPPDQIIEKLRQTGTVFVLRASDIVELSKAGVPNEVLDYLQRAQIDEMRWRDRAGSYWGWYSGAFGPCPWGYPSGFMGPRWRGGFWGC